MDFANTNKKRNLKNLLYLIRSLQPEADESHGRRAEELEAVIAGKQILKFLSLRYLKRKRSIFYIEQTTDIFEVKNLKLKKKKLKPSTSKSKSI